MAYDLGIDLGTTYTAAAIRRSTSVGGAPEVVSLGARSHAVASVLFLGDDGSVVVGEAAERRALTSPDRVAREFKRRIGDDVPIVVGTTPYPAHELAARTVRWVVDRVAEREGGPSEHITLTHPASWGAHRKELLERGLADVGLSDIRFLAEPQAAAISYASAERIELGSTIAVYDLGGGTFDAAVVRKTADGTFELLGQPEGIDRLGGVDFDEAVFAHVRAGLGEGLDSLDSADSAALAAVGQLRRECVDAKEALSADTEVTIPVLLAALRTQTRLVRTEFESMIRPALMETIEALRRALHSAEVNAEDLGAVLLVGGSSRIPLVAQLVSEELGRPVAVDADPKMAMALGAALAGTQHAADAQPATDEPLSGPEPASEETTASPETAPLRPPVTPGSAPRLADADDAESAGLGRRLVRPLTGRTALAGVGAVAALVVALLFWSTGPVTQESSSESPIGPTPTVSTSGTASPTDGSAQDGASEGRPTEEANPPVERHGSGSDTSDGEGGDAGGTGGGTHSSPAASSEEPSSEPSEGSSSEPSEEPSSVSSEGPASEPPAESADSSGGSEPPAESAESSGGSESSRTASRASGPALWPPPAERDSSGPDGGGSADET